MIPVRKCAPLWIPDLPAIIPGKFMRTSCLGALGEGLVGRYTVSFDSVKEHDYMHTQYCEASMYNTMILLCGSRIMMHRHFAPGPARITMRSIPTNLTPEPTTNTMMILDKIPRQSAQVHTRTATRLPSAIQPPRSPEVGDTIKTH